MYLTVDGDVAIIVENKFAMESYSTILKKFDKPPV
jgi:hypothetical protein